MTGGYHDLTEHCHRAEQSGHDHGRWSALSWHATLALIEGNIGAAADLSSNPEPWSMAIAGQAVAAAGTTAQREEIYGRLLPLAGFHIVTGGCASYSGSFGRYLVLRCPVGTRGGEPALGRVQRRPERNQRLPVG